MQFSVRQNKKGGIDYFTLEVLFHPAALDIKTAPARQSRIASRDNDIRFLVTIVLKNQEVEQENESWCRRI